MRNTRKLLFCGVLAVLSACDDGSTGGAATIKGQLMGDETAQKSSPTCHSKATQVQVSSQGEVLAKAPIQDSCEFEIELPANLPVSLEFSDANDILLGKVIYANPRIIQPFELADFLDQFLLARNTSHDLGNVFLVPEQALALLQHDPLKQLDYDDDGVVDALDPDFNLLALFSLNDVDDDGIENVDDNCPFDANQAQDDSNQDGIGDVCSVALDQALHGHLTLGLIKKLQTQEEVDTLMNHPEIHDRAILNVYPDEPNTVIFGPIPLQGNWVITDEQKVMVGPDGNFSLEPLGHPGSGIAKVVREPSDEKVLFSFPLHLLSTDPADPGVIAIKGSFPEPCGMDGAICHTADSSPATKSTHHHDHQESMLKALLQQKEQGEEGVTGSCTTDFNTRPCCLDYDGPLAGPDAEPQSESVTEVQVYLGSTCHESVLHNCCTNERGDFAYRAVEILRKFTDKIDELYEPIGCHQNHKLRNCQWIDYDTDHKGLYLSATPPSTIKRSARYLENTRHQTGSLFIENITVACGEEKPLYLYNNTCRNETVLHFERNIGGRAKLNGDGIESDREIPPNERANPLVVKHYKDGVDSFIFERSITYTAPSEPGSADAISVQAGGIHRRVNIEVTCPANPTETPAPTETPSPTETPAPTPTASPEKDAVIDIPEQTAYTFDHYIGESPCPQEIGQLTINNSGNGPLAWTITHAIPWLNVVPASGVAPSTVELQFNCNVDGPGNVSGKFAIESTDASNSPVSVPVGGTVHP